MEIAIQLRSFSRYLAVAAGGLLFAIVVASALTLDFRYSLAFIAGTILFASAISVVGSLRNLLLYAIAFNLPFTSIEKTFLLTTQTTFVTPGVPVGLADICILGLYGLWFVAIFVTRKERFPKLTTLDWWVFAFWLVHAISVFNATSPGLAILEVIRLGRYLMVYFYLAHNLRRQHLKWIVAGVLCAILIQSSLAVVQYRTGKLLGIGRTKGASDKDYEQYTVPGFEDVSRAEGTTFDSHALGLFFAMTLPIPLALALTHTILRPRYRILAGAAFIIGITGLVASFARAGWGAFAGGFAVLLVCLLRGQYRGSLKRLLPAFPLALILLVALIPLASKIRQRILEAPPELISARVETIEMAFDMWKKSPITGRGANNYMYALERDFSIFEGDPYFIPAHNMEVFVATELGVVGVTVLIGLGLVAFLKFWKIARSEDALLQSFGAALLAMLTAVFLEGLFDPIYTTTVTYYLLWFEMGLGAGLYRLVGELPRNSTKNASGLLLTGKDARGRLLLSGGQ